MRSSCSKTCKFVFILLFVGSGLSGATCAWSQNSSPIYPQFMADTANEIESNILPYTLPDPLLMPNSSIKP